jgi:integration host factor subunit alpha
MPGCLAAFSWPLSHRSPMPEPHSAPLSRGNGPVGGNVAERADLSEAVHRRVGVSRIESARLVNSVIDALPDEAAGEPVKLSSFGNFTVRQKNGRVGRNPGTGIEVAITPCRVLEFRASGMKERVNGILGDDRES